MAIRSFLPMDEANVVANQFICASAILNYVVCALVGLKPVPIQITT
jgi:hypothetical protein